MILSEWKAVLDTAVSVFSREPIELQLAIGLTVSFLTLMMLEGIRANFFARRAEAPAAPAKPAPTPAPVVAAEPPPPPVQTLAMLPASPASAPPSAPRRAAPPRKTMPVNRKRDTARPLAYRPTRPKIQAQKT